jgi:hypothetical protein
MNIKEKINEHFLFFLLKNKSVILYFVMYTWEFFFLKYWTVFPKTNSSIDQNSCSFLFKKKSFSSHCSSISSSVCALGDYLMSMFFVFLIVIVLLCKFLPLLVLTYGNHWLIGICNIRIHVVNYLISWKIYKSKLGSMTYLCVSVYYLLFIIIILIIHIILTVFVHIFFLWFSTICLFLLLLLLCTALSFLFFCTISILYCAYIYTFQVFFSSSSSVDTPDFFKTTEFLLLNSFGF